tara:strand:+ start:341 stop:2965 length:2625 start_codon:yes stop_codon:yes gene_type:complete
MTPIQQLLLGVGAKQKTYIDDVFSTYLWRGNGNDRTITNGIDLTGKGGLVWVKQRNSTGWHVLADTERDDPSLTGQSFLTTNGNNSQISDTNGVKYYRSTGFTTGGGGYVNGNGNTYGSWTFRKEPGFFDVVKYTGNATNRTISHSLKSVPGLIIIKCVSANENWVVYHRDVGSGKYLRLNSSAAAQTDSGGAVLNNGSPTSTTFSVGTHALTNGNGQTYIAYLFAGGKNTTATSRSVDFDGSNDWLTIGSSSDFTMGTGDFTIEGWVKFEQIKNGGLFQISEDSTGYSTAYDNSIAMSVGNSSGVWNCYAGGSGKPPSPPSDMATKYAKAPGKWIHFAYCRASGTSRIFLNGEIFSSWTDTYNYQGTYLCIGNYYSPNHELEGKISNFRIVKGTGLYTTTFKPPTEPLTNISGTVLLCCNNSSVTGSTVTPGTISVTGSVTADTDSPFDDPAAFVFGENEDQELIKCGGYEGTGSSGPEIYLGWEPSFIITKSSTYGDPWRMFDVMRGITTGGNESVFTPNLNEAEWSGDKIEVTPTGFKITTGAGDVNEDNQDFIYIAVRRSDGYVGKPVKAGTSVFAMDTGNGSSTIPAFDSGFPVDFGIKKAPASTGDWIATTRLTGLKYVKTNSTAAEGTSTTFVYDSNVGYAKSQDSTDQGWMWKRHAGFDVVTYDGNGSSGHSIIHSLGTKSPEMIWIKRRDTSGNAGDWMVGHKGLNGGSSPWNEYLVLNKTQGEADDNNPFNNVAPTTTSFQLSNWDRVNGNNSTYIAMLFASVDGISKCGEYSGGSSDLDLELGFAARFFLTKRITQTGSWCLYDTLRGIATGNDKRLFLNTSDAQTEADYVDPYSNGITLVAGVSDFTYSTSSSDKYIFYAHA